MTSWKVLLLSAVLGELLALVCCPDWSSLPFIGAGFGFCLLVFLALRTLFAGRQGSPVPVEYLADGYFGPEKDPKADNLEIRPFRISVPDDQLEDLKNRLRRTRYAPRLETDVGFSYGFPSGEVQSWVKYWAEDYDWKSIEAKLNQLPHFKTQIEGLDVHFIHIKPTSSRDTQPLLLLHGWPGSFVEFLKVIPLLTESKDQQNFELIIPSLPGYGFSDAPSRPGCTHLATARIFKKLMTDRLGHRKYFVHGGDWGAIVRHYIAVLFPDHVRGLHTTLPMAYMGLSFWVKVLIGRFAPRLVFDVPVKDWAKVKPLWDSLFQKLPEERGYSMLQATKPDTVGAGLTDSPAGLAAYILEKFTTWTYRTERDLAKLSPDELVSRNMSKDELLTNVIIYWLSGNVTPSVRFYKENWRLIFSSPLAKRSVGVPTGYADFPAEIRRLPRSLLKETFPRLIHTTSFSTGGHFAAFEEPRKLTADLRLFVSKVLALDD